MLQIGNTIVSLDILEQEFCCDLSQCRGACCVEGESGAPVTPQEVKQIEELYPQFKEYLSERNRAEISKQGFSVIDADGDLVTPLVGNNECAFTFVDDEGSTKCAIENSYFEKGGSFRKPISCHLFPIRITEYKRFDAVNYQQIEICRPGRNCGRNKKVPLWQYLKEPLIRKYGKKWYRDLETTAGVYYCKSESDIAE